MSEVAAKVAKEKNVKIKIPRAPKGEDNFMVVTLNGMGYKIMRGVEVEVPPAIAEIVEKALEARDNADDYIEKIANK